MAECVYVQCMDNGDNFSRITYVIIARDLERECLVLLVVLRMGIGGIAGRAIVAAILPDEKSTQVKV